MSKVAVRNTSLFWYKYSNSSPSVELIEDKKKGQKKKDKKKKKITMLTEAVFWSEDFENVLNETNRIR